MSHPAAERLRLAVYQRTLGFPDLADADHLHLAPVIRGVLAHGGQDRIGEPLAAKSTLHRFATETLARRANRRALVAGVLETGPRPLLARRSLPRRVYVDLASTEIEFHGRQEGAKNNGYFAARFCDCLVLFHLGRVLPAGTADEALTAGNLRTAFGVEVSIPRLAATGTLEVVPIAPSGAPPAGAPRITGALTSRSRE